MRYRLFILSLSAIVMSLCLAWPTHASSPGVVISEVQLQSQVDAGQEFVELYNNSDQPIGVDGWQVAYLTASTMSSTSLALLHGQIAAHGFITISKTGYQEAADYHFANNMSNISGHLVLTSETSQIIDKVGWGEAADPETTSVKAHTPGFSLQRKRIDSIALQDTNNNMDDFIQGVPTFANLPPLQPELPGGGDNSSAPCQSLMLSEILSNPAGVDTDGGEFVELYNPNDVEVPLVNCKLSTDKLSAYPFAQDAAITAKSYYAAALSGDLLNTGGTVTLIGNNFEDIVQYGELKDDEVWALIGNSWQLSNQPTPNAPNLPANQSATDGDDATAGGLKSCPEGKFRNPKTNRCKNIVNDGSDLVPCQAGQKRNPATNRCRKISTSSSSLKPCAANQERNPKTNRCRKIGAEATKLKPCKPGQERNPNTNRCRKVAAAPTHTPQDGSKGTSGVSGRIGLITVGVVGCLALCYGFYEYRSELRRWFARFRFRKHAAIPSD